MKRSILFQPDFKAISFESINKKVNIKPEQENRKGRGPNFNNFLLDFFLITKTNCEIILEEPRSRIKFTSSFVRIHDLGFHESSQNFNHKQKSFIPKKNLACYYSRL